MKMRKHISFKRKYTIWLFPVAIAVVIFCFSAQPGDDSSQMSNGVVEILIHLIEKTGMFRDMGGEEIVSALSLPIRKGAHVTEYMVLCISLLTAFYISGVGKPALEISNDIAGCAERDALEMKKDMTGHIGGYKWIALSMLVTFLYACTDEFHQTFIPGRAGRFTDVLIDCTGALVLCIVMACIQRRRMHAKL